MAQILADTKKIYAERVHAKRRALERAGINYNRFDLRRIAEQIRQGYSVEVAKSSNTHRIHLLAFREYNGAPTRVHIVVYNRRTKQVVTFLDGLV